MRLSLCDSEVLRHHWVSWLRGDKELSSWSLVSQSWGWEELGGWHGSKLKSIGLWVTRLKFWWLVETAGWSWGLLNGSLLGLSEKAFNLVQGRLDSVSLCKLSGGFTLNWRLALDLLHDLLALVGGSNTGVRVVEKVVEGIELLEASVVNLHSHKEVDASSNSSNESNKSANTFQVLVELLLSDWLSVDNSVHKRGTQGWVNSRRNDLGVRFHGDCIEGNVMGSTHGGLAWNGDLWSFILNSLKDDVVCTTHIVA